MPLVVRPVGEGWVRFGFEMLFADCPFLLVQRVRNQFITLLRNNASYVNNVVLPKLRELYYGGPYRQFAIDCIREGLNLCGGLADHLANSRALYNEVLNEHQAIPITGEAVFDHLRFCAGTEVKGGEISTESMDHVRDTFRSVLSAYERGDAENFVAAITADRALSGPIWVRSVLNYYHALGSR